jgi:hypothetical protein
MDQEKMRTYQAIVWRHPTAAAQCVTVLTRGLGHATLQIEGQYGKNAVVFLWSEDDANAPR